MQHAFLEENHSLTIGQRLRKRRNELGFSIPYVSEKTRIAMYHIKALEEDNHEIFSSTVYSRGFLKSYAKFLSLDLNVEPEKNTHQFVFPIQDIDKALPKKWIVVSSFLLACVISYKFLDIKEKKPSAQPVSVEKEVASIEVNDEEMEKLSVINLGLMYPDLGKPFNEVEAIHSEVPLKVTLVADQKCWVEIRDSENNVLEERMLEANESMELPSGPGLYLTTGNAGGMFVKIGETVLPKFGRSGFVKRNISIDELVASVKK